MTSILLLTRTQLFRALVHKLEGFLLGNMIADSIIKTVTPRLQECKVLNETEVIDRVREIGSGDVSEAFCCTSTSSGKTFFVKVCRPTRGGQSLDEIVDMFKAEAKGLKAIDDTKTIRVPTPYAYGALDDGSAGYLALEFIKFGTKYGGTSSVQRKLGEQLADLHLAKGPDKFGFEVNNTIGSTPQDNTWSSDWVSFWRRRLEYQFELAKRHKHLAAAGQELLSRLDTYFEGLDIKPSLLHGDLWSGNWSVDEEGNPVIMDPATYYGHSEADLGIMRLFGGLNSEFYDAYHAKIPKAPGYEKRVNMYALYHALNHLNMFGSSYLGTSMSYLSKVLE